MAKNTKTKSKKKPPYKDNGMPDGHPEDNIYNHHIRIIDQDPPNYKGE